MSETQRIPPIAAALGYGGLLPFAAAALACWLGGDAADFAGWVLRGYSCAILAFLGGVPWGLALASGEGSTGERLSVGVVPALVAWIALLLPVASALGVLVVAFAAVYGWDELRNLSDTPAWFRRLRRHLTAGVVACHLVALPVAI